MSEEKELPEGWCWASLEELAYRIGDVDHKMPKPVDLGIPYISTKNFYGRDNIDFETAKQISYEDYADLSRKIKPEKGDILLSRYGTVGEVRKISTNMDFQASYSIAIIKTIPIPMLTNYLVFALRSEIVQAQIKRDTRATAQPDLGLEHIRHFQIPLAPLREQQRIVSAIEERFTILDVVTTTLQQNKQKLKRTRASVLKHAIEGKLTEKWRAEHPAVESGPQLLERILAERRAKWEAEQLAKGKDPRKLRYEEPKEPDVIVLPDLPEGWCWARAEQFCEFITKGTTPAADKLHNENGDIPFIKVYNLTHNGYLDFSVKPTFVDKDTHTHDLARSKVFPGDVLMNIVGPPLGKVSVVPDTYSEWNINQAIVFFRPIDGYNRKLLVISILTEHILIWATKRAKTTAGQHNLTLEICRDLPFPLPPLAEQQQIVAEVERRLSVIEQAEIAIETSLNRIERARQSILELAFSGRLVLQDPNDEPASVLLERIQQERTRRVVEGKRRGSNGGVKVARGKKAKAQEFVPQWQLLKDAQPSELLDGLLSSASAHENGTAEKGDVEQDEMDKEELYDLVQMPLLLWD